MFGHEQCCLGMRHSGEGLLLVTSKHVSGYGHSGRPIFGHGWRCPDMKSSREYVFPELSKMLADMPRSKSTIGIDVQT